MALNGKYVKIGRILEGIHRDFGWTHEVNWVDAIEWVGEVMDLIAAPSEYIDRITDDNEDIGNPCPIEVKNFRGKMPCDLVFIEQVRDYKSKQVLRHSTDTYHTGAGAMKAEDCQTDLTYTINDCYIFTNFKEGVLEMAYKAFPVDEDGLPLVPDNVKYIQAVKFYIAEKIAMRLFMQDKISRDKFQYIQGERDWYVGAATTAAVAPSVDQMESWKNAFVRLIPNLNMHATSFKYNGDAQQRINHSTR